MAQVPQGTWDAQQSTAEYDPAQQEHQKVTHLLIDLFGGSVILFALCLLCTLQELPDDRCVCLAVLKRAVLAIRTPPADGSMMSVLYQQMGLQLLLLSRWQIAHGGSYPRTWRLTIIPLCI